MSGTDEDRWREGPETEKSARETDEPGHDESSGNGNGSAADWDNPLHDIVERTKADPGACFRAEVVEQNLAAAWRLKRDNQGAWITLRKQLGRAGLSPLSLLDDRLRAWEREMRQQEKPPPPP